MEFESGDGPGQAEMAASKSRPAAPPFSNELFKDTPTINDRYLIMPEKKTIQRAQEDKREGKAPSTQAGEFVREEIEHIREGKHGVRSTKQAIAIGLSKARRAGVKLSPPKEETTSESTRRQAKRDLAKGERDPGKRPSAKRSRATTKALQRESRQPASRAALSKHAKSAARKRSAADKSASARRAARTRRKSPSA
jgi:hypothetical protein